MKDGERSTARYVLDTSAVLALIENEAGARRVEEILRTQRVLLPFLVSLEIYYLTLRERGEDMADERYAVLKVLPVSHLNEIDEPTLLTAGRFKALHRLSVSDALIAAFAARHNAILVHKDPEFEALENHVRQEALPYKPRVSRGER